MPLYNWSELNNRGARGVAVTTVGETLIFAWRNKSNQLNLGTAPALEIQGQTLEDVFEAAERSDAAPALGVLHGRVYLAWKGDDNAQLNLARVVLERRGDTWRVVGLDARETLEQEGEAPLALLPHGDRFILSARWEKSTMLYEIIVEDPNAVDPLGPVGSPAPGMESACEIRVITSKDEMYLTCANCPDTWTQGGILPVRDRLLLGPGWYSLFLALKDGRPDVYQAGDSSEWQSIAGEQVYLDEQGDQAFDDSWMEGSDEEEEGEEQEDGDDEEVGDDEESDGDSSPAGPDVNPPYWHYLAISSSDDLAGYVEALDALDEEGLRGKYAALAATEYASRLSAEDFAEAWQALQDLREFLRRAAQAGLYTLHRMRRPADAPAEVPPPPEVAVAIPTEAEVGELAPGRLGILANAMDSFGIQPNHPDNQWPFNLLSQRTVMYRSGRVACAGDALSADHDPQELERCLRYAAEFAARIDRLPIRTFELGKLEPFCLPVTREEASSEELTPERVRALFRGTVNPWAQITLESLDGYSQVREIGNEASMHGYRSRDVRLHNLIWDDAMRWLHGQPEVRSLWYVAIEPGFALAGAQAVRLLVGLTQTGSLTGAVTVERASGMALWMDLSTVYSEYQNAAQRAFGAWQDPQTRQYIARGTLRAYDAEAFAAWENEVNAGLRELREPQHAAYQLAMFPRLQAQRELHLGVVWTTLHRCLTLGSVLESNPPNSCEFLVESAPGEDRSCPAYHQTWQTEQLNGFLAQLNERTEAWLQERYRDLRATDYAPQMSEADLQATLQAFRDLKVFLQAAVDGDAVVDFEITTRTEEQLAKELVLPGPIEQRANPAPDLQPGEVGDCLVGNEFLAPLQPCMTCYYSEDPETEWDNTSVSRLTVRYSCGNLGRLGQQAFHRHDSKELSRCQALAGAAGEMLRPVEPAHDQGGPFLPFFVTANVGEPVATGFTENFVRQRVFGGVLCPENSMMIEPMSKGGSWWDSYVRNHWIEEEQEAENAKWSAFVDWFLAQPGLHGHAFVMIGLGDDDMGPSHPRLAVALTDQGSIVGVCGYVIFA